MASSEWPVRRQGDRDHVVRTIQLLLSFHGESVNADGVFGAATAEAVARFQSEKGVAADGVVGGETWEALLVEVKKGDRGEAVRAAQAQLYIRGTLPGVDGDFGIKTDISVRRLQVVKQIAPSGAVDRATWLQMVSDRELPSISRELGDDGFDWQAKLRSMLRPEG